MNIKKRWKIDSVPLPLLDSCKLAWLKDFSEEHIIIPGIGSALLAINDTTFEITDPVYITDTLPYGLSLVPQITSVKINKMSRLLKVYPNPTNGQITVEWEGNVPQNSLVSVMDAMGKVIIIKKFNPSQKSVIVNLEGLPAGIYYARISSNNKIFETHKIILTK